MYKRAHLLIALLLASCPLFLLQAKAITIPREHVFVFERNTNTNYVCYDINLDGGKLNQKEPLQTYWVLGHETRIEPLTFLDRKMAFGVRVIRAKEEEAIVHLTAYKNLNIRICKHKGKWVGIVKVNSHEMIVQKMFAQMKAPMNVKCEHVDIFGTDVTTGEKHRERIKP